MLSLKDHPYDQASLLARVILQEEHARLRKAALPTLPSLLKMSLTLTALGFIYSHSTLSGSDKCSQPHNLHKPAPRDPSPAPKATHCFSLLFYSLHQREKQLVIRLPNTPHVLQIFLVSISPMRSSTLLYCKVTSSTLLYCKVTSSTKIKWKIASVIYSLDDSLSSRLQKPAGTL